MVLIIKEVPQMPFSPIIKKTTSFKVFSLFLLQSFFICKHDASNNHVFKLKAKYKQRELFNYIILIFYLPILFYYPEHKNKKIIFDISIFIIIIILISVHLRSRSSSPFIVHIWSGIWEFVPRRTIVWRHTSWNPGRTSK